MTNQLRRSFSLEDIDMIILGINCVFEHPAVALLIDGELSFAAEEERFSRIKGGHRWSPFNMPIPFNSIVAAFKHCGITAADIDHIAFSYSLLRHIFALPRVVAIGGGRGLAEHVLNTILLLSIRKQLAGYHVCDPSNRNILRPPTLQKAPFTYLPHHMCHASSAYFLSGYESALILTYDANGEDTCTQISIGNGSHIKPLYRLKRPHSLGALYSAVTEHLGFREFSDEYKVMGLASYGKPSFQKHFDNIIRLCSRGAYSVNLNALRNLEQFLGSERSPSDPIDEKHADIASSLQQVFESALLHMLRYWGNRTGQRRLCLAGGCALNCVANGRVYSEGLFTEIFVQPASNDAGTAIGAAALINTGYQKANAQIKFSDMFVGTEYSEEQCKSACQDVGAGYEYIENIQALADRVAAFLYAGKVGAVFKGRMEFGPRSLGNRSIFADAGREYLHDLLNSIKGREQFRPLAPVVTKKAFDKLFTGYPSKYMLFCSAVRSRHSVPAAVHIDNSARVQVVSDESNFTYILLKAFGKLSGVEALINTSFNIGGKPIVEHPSEALSVFMASRLDFLVLGNCLLVK